jgi:phospholipid-binding lipoprotein MlaA
MTPLFLLYNILRSVLQKRKCRDRVICQLMATVLLSGCASGPRTDAIDPYEAANRKVFAFNEGADRALLSPLARGYREVTPTPIQRGIRNALANIGDFGGAINAGLQGRGRRAVRNASRLVVNTTVGLFGLFDVASRLGIERYETDFGQTLAVWGLEQGPYLVLPLLGPRTARSGLGSGVDFMLQQSWRGGVALLPAAEAVDSRAALLDAEDLISGDRYLFIRDAYLQRRAARLGIPPQGADFPDSEAQFDWGD